MTVRRCQPGAPSWRPRTAELPTEELAEELRRRGLAVLVLDPDEQRRLPGLTLLGRGRGAVWRGRLVRLTRRQEQVLAVLGGAWPRPVTAASLRRAVWGAWGDDNLARLYVAYLRARLPGLIETLGRRLGYRLALPPYPEGAG